MVKDSTDKFELLESLGVGGFGKVYKAVSEDGRVVALKTLNPHFLDDQNIVNKFFHEAKILSKLSHPNICKLLDYFTDRSVCTIVMEYVDGTDLKDLMFHEPGNSLPFRRSCNIANQCLTAFQYAYEMGILHRDIKPSNIMIKKDGNSIIMDFGIATSIGDNSHDMRGHILSPAYSSPERFRQAEKADISSDIYSMGMVFYELFTGRKPFSTTDRSEIESWHMNEIPEPVNSLNPSLSSKITAAINTALEKRPENRFKDFLEFKDAMELDNI